MKLKELEVSELFVRIVKKSGNGAVIPFLKKYIGKEVYVVIPKESRKLSQILGKKELKKLKENMKRFIKLKPTNYTVAINQKLVKDLLACFKELEEKDLTYLDPLLK